ncbi:MAG TPA: hypothetical protein VIJ00_18685, partial [Nakamurella sp.]
MAGVAASTSSTRTRRASAAHPVDDITGPVDEAAVDTPSSAADIPDDLAEDVVVADLPDDASVEVLLIDETVEVDIIEVGD